MRKVLTELGETKSEERLKILDVAGGTGDISFRILNKARKDSPGCKNTNYDSIELSVDITVSDINP